MPRRAWLALGLGAVGLWPPGRLQAQPAPYPSRPVKVVVGFTAGGTTDLLARQVTAQLSDRLKQNFLIENRPGAGGNIGTEAVIRSAPDGYTLIVNSVGPVAVNPSLYARLGYNPLVDLVPVVQIADVPNVLVVPPSLPARSLEEFITLGKASAGKLNYASTGVGTSSHLSSFMLSRHLELGAVHLPYKGADALQDLMAGRVQFMFATIPSVMTQIRAGKLRPLAVSSLKRSRSLPDVPTVAEKGFPGFEAGSWFGLFAPRGTPESVIALLNRHVNAILQSPALEQQMILQGADPVGGSAAQFGQFIQREFEKWRQIVRESGATAE